MRILAAGAAGAMLVAVLAMPPALAQEPSPVPSPDPTATATPPTEPPTDAPAAPPTADPEPAASPEPSATALPEAGASAAPIPDPYDPATPPPSATPDPAHEAAASAARVAAEQVRIRAVAAAELERGRIRLAQAESARDAARQELADARAAERALIADQEAAAGAQGDARRELGNLVRLAYTSGPTEWTLIETILDADSPGMALRRASDSRRVAERQHDKWTRTAARVVALDAQRGQAAQRIEEASAAVAATLPEAAAAAEQVRALEAVVAGGGIAAGTGAEAVAEVCGDADIPQCEPTGWGEDKLTRDAVWIMRTVQQRWPDIESVGGWRPTDTYPDHPSGRAVDVMMPDGGRSEDDTRLGDQIARYFMERADQYGVMYLIWHQRIWMNGRDPVEPPDQWRMMGDRGGWTANHMDHVHITLSTGASGSDIYGVVAATPDPDQDRPQSTGSTRR